MLGGERPRGDGVGLVELPGFMHGVTAGLLSDGVWGVPGGRVRGFEHKGMATPIALQVRGAGCGELARRLMAGVGDGTLPMVVEVEAGGVLNRTEVYPLGVSGVEYFGGLYDPGLVRFTIQAEWPVPLWDIGEPVSVAVGLQGLGAGWRAVHIPMVGGVVPFPDVRVQGGYWGLLGLALGSEGQHAVFLPAGGGDVQVFTSPARAEMLKLNGGEWPRVAEFYWPEPPTVQGGQLVVYMRAERANGTATFTYQPKGHRAW